MIRAQTELRFEKRNSTSKVSNQNLHFNWMSGRLATLTPDFGSSISMIDYKLQSSRAGTALLSPDNVLSSVECAEIVGAILYRSYFDAGLRGFLGCVAASRFLALRSRRLAQSCSQEAPVATVPTDRKSTCFVDGEHRYEIPCHHRGVADQVM